MSEKHKFHNEEGIYFLTPWGSRRNPLTWKYESSPWPHLFDRGFTGHQHLDGFNLINMNGRVYDPWVGRFLSPDPFVQASGNTQNYNRYSYVLNNPLKYVDPSGYYFGPPVEFKFGNGLIGPRGADFQVGNRGKIIFGHTNTYGNSGFASASTETQTKIYQTEDGEWHYEYNQVLVTRDKGDNVIGYQEHTKYNDCNNDQNNDAQSNDGNQSATLPDWNQLSLSEKIEIILNAARDSGLYEINLNELFRNVSRWPDDGKTRNPFDTSLGGGGLKTTEPVNVTLGGFVYSVYFDLSITADKNGKINPIVNLAINIPDYSTFTFGPGTRYYRNNSDLNLVVYGPEEHGKRFWNWYYGN